MDPLARARAAFEAQFGYSPSHFFQAPGRVNLIGEHTDYNDGFVLPCAINFKTVIAASPRDDVQVRVVAADYDQQRDEFSLHDQLQPRTDAIWPNYVRGTIKHTLERHILDSHRPLRGMDLAVSGDIPQGAGLSSSASLEVAIGVACNELGDLGLDATEIALTGQAAENHFVGTQCGIMDQLASAQGQVGHALLLDCRALTTRLIRVPDDLAVIIVDSNVTRGLLDSEYNTRRAQTEAAASALGLKALRDINEESFLAAQAALPTVVAQRARHVITENARTIAAANALETGSLRTLGELMAASHRSMRDDFEITVPPIDALVSIIDAVLDGDGGVRMTGGGFGGCVVALAPREQVPDIAATVERHYEPSTGLRATLHVCQVADGAGPIPAPT